MMKEERGKKEQVKEDGRDVGSEREVLKTKEDVGGGGGRG